jgi:hypothetical protein
MPNASYNDHPCHDVALGERLVKDIYEALRAGPGWNRTLFLTACEPAQASRRWVVPGTSTEPAPLLLQMTTPAVSMTT